MSAERSPRPDAASASWSVIVALTSAQPIGPLTQIAGQFGMSEQQFKGCLADQKMIAQINAVRQYEQEELHLTSIPWFLFNGQPINFGFTSFDQFVDAVSRFELGRLENAGIHLRSTRGQAFVGTCADRAHLAEANSIRYAPAPRPTSAMITAPTRLSESAR